MAKTFRTYLPEQNLLLPASLREWLPDDHLAYFVSKLRDWRDPAALKDFSDGEIFYIVNNGTGQMSGEEGRVKPEQIWEMVNYIRSLAKNGSPLTTKDEKPKGLSARAWICESGRAHSGSSLPGDAARSCGQPLSGTRRSAWKVTLRISCVSGGGNALALFTWRS
jgi:hypothetical protein